MLFWFPLAQNNADVGPAEFSIAGSLFASTYRY